MAPQISLTGREAELAVIADLLDAVRSGKSGCLVLRGEAGVGKTVLLDHALASASDLTALRAIGVESEMELAFAGLHQLCAPLLDRLDRLPGPQCKALRVAFGLSDGEPPERFVVGVAALNLFSEAAEEQPLLCVVDDAQWLDEESALALGFLARRLYAESVAIVLATRTSSERFYGLPELAIEGLGLDDARSLLASSLPGPLDEQVRDRFVAETRGNPLALVELPRGLAAAELAGGFGVLDSRPLAVRIESSFLRRLDSLPVDTRRLLLVAAAEPVGDLALLWGATEVLGIGAEAAAPAQTAGLIELGATVRFRHPLVRSAVYREAAVPERREAHRALAEATDPAVDPDRHAWHRARAAVGPDEEVAAELESSAERAHRRGGLAAAAAFLERATQLTPDSGRRGSRALAAAQGKFEAADPDAAYELLAVAERCPLDELQRAQLARLRAHIVFARRRGSDAPPLLLAAAEKLDPLDPALARETYLEALGAAIYAGRLGGEGGIRRAAEAARRASPSSDPARSIDLLLDGMATWFTAGPAAGVPPLQRALDAFRDEQLGDRDEVMRWLWLCTIAQETAAHELWDDATWHDLAVRAVGLSRRAGAITILPVVLPHLAGDHLHAGDFANAAALIEEAEAVATATGNAALRYAELVLVAWRGKEKETLELAERGVEDATARGEGRMLGLVGYATAILYNGLGRYEDALGGVEHAREDEDAGFFAWVLPERIEAAVRCGDPEAAERSLRFLAERTQAAGTEWALGIEARSRALLGEGEAADALYAEAIERLGHSRMLVHLARAQLLYGEWLRREKRRQAARKQLRAAYETFSQIGAEGFAARARRELAATGETVRKRSGETADVLTPQEAQIARMARDGLSNTEIGGQLFISPRTVQYHLHKVFAKLSITSRRHLGRVPPALLNPS